MPSSESEAHKLLMLEVARIAAAAYKKIPTFIGEGIFKRIESYLDYC